VGVRGALAGRLPQLNKSKNRFNPDGIKTSKTFHWASRAGADYTD